MSDGDTGEVQPQAERVVYFAPGAGDTSALEGVARPLSADAEGIQAVLPPRHAHEAAGASPPHHGLSVSFRNNYPTNVKAAVMRFDPGACGEHGKWATAGWWRLEPGQQVFGFSTNNRYVGFYAVAEDGAVWEGQYGPVFIREEDFQSCVDLQPEDPCQQVGMRLADLGTVGIVINLTQG
jgi:hypothetical protein